MLSFYEFLKVYPELDEYMEGIQVLAYEVYQGSNSSFEIGKYLEKYDKGEYDDGKYEECEA